MKKIVPSLRIGSAALLAITIFSSSVPAALAKSSRTSHSSSSSSSSAGSIEISGWIPYWATDKGTADASANLNELTEINPFGFSVKTDGSLADTANISSSAWQDLFKNARSNNVKVVPTIMWSDTGSIYSVLSNPALRAAHIQSIVNAVTQYGFDGVDIDYEGKSAETRNAYSSFLTELSAALYAADKNDVLDCTIEARMPLEARYSGTPPANIEYANDLPTINKVCDRVRIMTYDQQTADVQLNASHSASLYAPIADTAWVEKVVKYMSIDIDPNKIEIGVATYGAEYQAMSNVDGSGFTYTKTSSFNPQYALGIADQYGLTPSRNASGELFISYVPKEQSSQLPSNSVLSKLAPKGTDSGSLAAAGALAYSRKQSRQAPVTFLTWSDAGAIQDKVQLAQKLGVAGVAIFKLDGSEDPAMWSSISSTAKATKDPSTSRSVIAPITIPSVPAMPVIPSPSSTPATAPVPVQSPAMPVTPQLAPSSSKTFKADLQSGDENADVTRLQTILIKKGFMKVAANGYFGPATKAALMTWQKTVGISASGYFGPLSRAKIGS